MYNHRLSVIQQLMSHKIKQLKAILILV